jgi:hypothetical protein
MKNEQNFVIITDIKKPKNCEIKIIDMGLFIKILINKKEYQSIINSNNENEKILLHMYLNELESKLKDTNKKILMVQE